MIAVNSLFPHTLNAVKNRCGAEVIHITTDCVFNGSKGNYNENDLHDCVDQYGKSKSLGENLNLTNIRTSIIGEEQRNKKSLLEWVRSNRNKTIDGYENHLWNGVTCLELTHIIEMIIAKKNYWNGIRHVFSPNTVSKYELASTINNIYNLDIKINKTQAKENCYRNLSTVYNNIYTEKTIEEQIKELKQFSL
jgi:dTDP-4-dehydrorhamnose reductase